MANRHPGVHVIKRSRRGRVDYRARWVDPLTGNRREKSLTRLGLRGKGREDWCIRKSQEIQGLLVKVGAGQMSVESQMAIGDAVADYLARASERLAAPTVAGYRHRLDALVSWGKDCPGVATLASITRPRLEAFRDRVVRLGRSARYRNDILSAVSTFLQEARRLGRLPNLDGDGIKDGTRRIRVEIKAPDYLRHQEMKQLLDAALRHDARCWKLTREERQGQGSPGTTRRHEEDAAPLLLVTLLTGMRRGEVVGLEWSDVHLDGGQPEIILPAHKVKTRRSRAIDLAITPGLVTMLKAMRLRAGDASHVFPCGAETARRIIRRLVADYGAPEATGFQMLRRTCCTYLTNSGVYGRSTPWHAAKRAGHSIQVAERRYLGVLRDLPDASTIEGLMGIEEQLQKATGRLSGEEVAIRAG